MGVERFREGDIILIRFSDGEPLLEGLKQVLVAEGVHSGIVLGGVGMLSSPGIAFYKGGGKYDPIPLRDEVEICALSGNIATVDGDVFIHVHATLGTSTGQAFAGHFTGGKVHMTAEVAVRVLRTKMIRELDSKLGLKTLRFGPST
jgi:predicted DNA-binding protein with PD1-like motif